MADLPALLTPAQACEYLQISRSALYRRIKAGHIETVKLPGGDSSPIRIIRDALLEALGLIDHTTRRRRTRQAAAEIARAEQIFGVKIAGAN